MIEPGFRGFYNTFGPRGYPDVQVREAPRTNPRPAAALARRMRGAQLTRKASCELTPRADVPRRALVCISRLARAQRSCARARRAGVR